jgi:hypothetical protein
MNHGEESHKYWHRGMGSGFEKKNKVQKVGSYEADTIWDREWVDDDRARFDTLTTSWKVS